MHTHLTTATASQKPPDDLCLLEGIGAGDAVLLEKFFLRWRSRFCSMAVGILGNHDDAEDAASDALVRVHHLASAGRFPPSPQDATRWIVRVARNCAFRQRGERLTLRGEWIEHLPARDNAADEGCDSEETVARQAAITKALPQLPRRMRSAVRMYFVDGLSCSEIAERQGGTAAGARSRVERGILRLVAITHSRRRGIQKAEHAESLSPQERAQILNAVAIARAHSPHLGVRGISAEVCRRTRIFIPPESVSASLLMDLHRRSI